MRVAAVLILACVAAAPLGCGSLHAVGARPWPTASALRLPPAPLLDVDGDPDAAESDGSLVHFDLLWYIPNRILDVIDVVRADVGVGFATGLKIRAGDIVQVGWRSIDGILLPFMPRVGLFGRRFPVMLETDDELFLGPIGVISDDRIPTWGEVGAGVDVIVVGAYVAVCIDELVDLVLGLAFLDFKGDDLGR